MTNLSAIYRLDASTLSRLAAAQMRGGAEDVSVRQLGRVSVCVWTSQLIDFHEVILLGGGRHPFGRGAGFSEGSDRTSYVCLFCSLMNV